MPSWALAVLLQTSPRDRAVNPARARGLKRAARYRAPCEPAEATPMPAPVDAVHLLALLTRVRQARIDSGEIKAPAGKRGQTSRLYDVRAFKSALAELGYLRRLAHGGRTGGTVLTSMAQLVVGLARLHPAWKIDGDRFADRDRHHRAVRRRLRDLQDMGLLAWRVGVDVDGEDARTELQLREPAQVSVQELADAAAQLKRWQARYGPALNTGSSTGIRNAARHGRPLSASERQRRAIARTRARASSRRVASFTNSDPHCVASATPKNNPESSAPPPKTPDACGAKTGVTRARATAAISASSAVNAPKTASLTVVGPAGPGQITVWDEQVLRARVAARVAARAPVLEVIASQAARRALQVAGWTLDRGWPVGRVGEAWVVWRYGAMCAAEHGAAAAGPLHSDDLVRLRRAAARYERHVAARPQGFPVLGLAALAQIARVAGERDVRPQTLHYAIGALDQLSRRMRASETADDPARRDRQAARAKRRLRARQQPGPLAFRTLAWPSWVALDEHGAPILTDGELRLVAQHGVAPAPGREDPAYLAVLRDAHLLTGLWAPLHTDGRATMAHGDDRDPHHDRRRARPGPYPAPQHRARPEPEDLELARRAAITVRDAQHVDADLRDRLLRQLRADDTRRQDSDRETFWQHIHASPPSQPGA
ncbi:MAG TPA: hypothetical protein VF526_11700 [Solirubrobacteraceae bacterium]